jgi:hypothetical protein
MLWPGTQSVSCDVFAWGQNAEFVGANRQVKGSDRVNWHDLIYLTGKVRQDFTNFELTTDRRGKHKFKMLPGDLSIALDIDGTRVYQANELIAEVQKAKAAFHL